jgi:excisionase family DNA binding protein
MNKQETLLTSKDVAEKFNVSGKTIERWRKKGQIKFYSVGPRSIRFKKEDVEEFLKPRANG